MNYDFLVGLIVGIAFTIVVLIIMAILHAAGEADDQSDEIYRQHLEASIAKRKKEENSPLFCESSGCNNELVHRQEMLWGKCDSCMYHGGADLRDEEVF